MMIGYKAFNANFACRNFQYVVGQTYEMDGEIKPCERGFHFCENIADCFRYYSSTNARFAKVEALGDVIRSNDDSKCVTNKIKILEEIPRDEAVRMSNSGNRNSGNRNSGDWNSGNRNSGNRNSGDRNSGDWNSGDRNSGNRNFGNWNSGDWNFGNWNSGDWNFGNWNSGDWNVSSCNNGCFMSVKPVIMMFNKPTDWTIEVWRNSRACEVMSDCPIEYTDTDWVFTSEMTDKEKADHPDHETTGGYLKVIKHKADKQAWWDGLSKDDKDTVKSLPNFDAEIFYQCTGIRAEDKEN